MHTLSRHVFAAFALGLPLACRAPAPAPAPAPTPTHDMATTSPPPDTARVRHGYTAADVRFVQGMIAHHGQALVMTALVPSRASSDAVKLLAERIDASQKTEIATMQRWLRERGEMVPAADGHDLHAMMGHDMAGMTHDSSGAMLMPGMLTPAELQRLAAASGVAFDRLFLEDMIRHHEGAIRMVADLFHSPGAAQESQLYDFATGVDADQRAEIARMRAMLGS